MELVGVEDRVVVKSNTVQLKAIGFGKTVEHCQAVGTWLAGLKKDCIDLSNMVAAIKRCRVLLAT